MSSRLGGLSMVASAKHRKVSRPVPYDLTCFMISFLMAGDIGTLLLPTLAWVHLSNRPSGAPWKAVNQLCNNYICVWINRYDAKKNYIWKCRLFMLSAKYSCKLFKPIFAYGQTVWTLIRLHLEEQSDLGPHCLQKWLLKSQADDKADNNCCDWQFKG